MDRYGVITASRRANGGFTLVELLVVLTVLSLASAVVIMNAPRVRSDLRLEAERFAARLRICQSYAVAAGAPVRVAVDQNGYTFQRLSGAEWKAVAEQRQLQPRRMKSSVLIRAEVDDISLRNEEALGQTRAGSSALPNEDEPVYFEVDPVGLQNAVSVVFSTARDSSIVALAADGTINISDRRPQ